MVADKRVPTSVLPVSLRALFPWSHLNDMQSECFEAAFNSDASLIVASPTGSGKTGIMSLALARLWASNTEPRSIAIYVVRNSYTPGSSAAERSTPTFCAYAQVNLICSDFRSD